MECLPHADEVCKMSIMVLVVDIPVLQVCMHIIPVTNYGMLSKQRSAQFSGPVLEPYFTQFQQIPNQTKCNTPDTLVLQHYHTTFYKLMQYS